MSVLGKYRNERGANIEVTGYYIGVNVLGTIYTAISLDTLFGDRNLIVTPEGLIECGYTKVEEGTE